MRVRFASLVLALAAFALPAQAQNVDVSILAATCAGCHGGNLDGSGPIPGLKGQQQAYLGNQLQAFKVGARPATVMNRLARGYSDDEIVALAEHFSKMK